jgi:HPt (histidine-containing phosphotransfer) domain-containing protein
VGEPTLDRKAIDAIQALRSPNLLRRMIALYDEHTPRLLSEGSAALAGVDAKGVANAAHELKSASANLGAHRLSRLCKECEHAARSGDLPRAEPLWSQVIQEHGVFRNALADIEREVA